MRFSARAGLHLFLGLALVLALLLLTHVKRNIDRLLVHVQEDDSNRCKALYVDHVPVHDSDGRCAAVQGKLSTSDFVRQMVPSS
jgi:hypothetical protein